MLGNFSSDSFEQQYEKLRQGSGGTYFIMVQQILEKVSIYKIKLLLKLDEEVQVLKNLESEHSCQKFGFLPN